MWYRENLINKSAGNTIWVCEAVYFHRYIIISFAQNFIV